MKSLPFFVLGLLASLFVCGSGCAAGRESAETPQVGSIAAEDGESVIRLGRASGDTLLKAFQQNDFEMVKTLPFGDEKNTLTEARFRQVVEKVIRANGVLRDSVYLGDLNRPPYKMLLWKVTFTPAPKASADAPDKKPASSVTAPETPAEGMDMLFEMWMGKLNDQYRIVGFRFKL